MASTRDARWFAWALAGVALVALAVRVTYVLLERQDLKFGGDAYFYHAGANLLVDGKGFISPFGYLEGREVPAAEHPPLYLLYLSIASLVGAKSVLQHLLWSCLLGTGTVVVVGLIGRAVVSARVGIIAAVIVAMFPGAWAHDGALEAETLAMFTTALSVLLAYHYLRQPSWGRIAAVGAAAGLAALTRSELILLVPMLVLPLALLTRQVDLRARLKWLGVGVLGTVVVIGPWVGFNMTRFEHPVYLSSQFEATLASANCDTVYEGDLIGYFSINCAVDVLKREKLPVFADQSELAKAYRKAAVEYIEGHLSDVPVVVAARVGRILGVFSPGQQLRIDELLDQREAGVARASLYGFYVLAILSVVGAIALRRRRTVPVYPLLIPPAVVLVSVILTYANTRFRAVGEVTLAVLAAIAIDFGIRAVRREPAVNGTGSDDATPRADESELGALPATP